MSKKIIQINHDLCIGCGLCTTACHQGVIVLENNKAVVKNENYCDGIGNCMPGCPVNAISFSDKDIINIIEESKSCVSSVNALSSWPIQLKLVSTNASFFNNAKLVIAADCCGYAYRNFHQEFIDNKITLIGCPKLDDFDYTMKIKDIINNNQIESIEVLKMEVPCCNKMHLYVQKAVEMSFKTVEVKYITVSRDGKIIG